VTVVSVPKRESVRRELRASVTDRRALSATSLAPSHAPGDASEGAVGGGHGEGSAIPRTGLGAGSPIAGARGSLSAGGG
jgi:hypothetical protein